MFISITRLVRHYSWFATISILRTVMAAMLEDSQQKISQMLAYLGLVFPGAYEMITF